MQRAILCSQLMKMSLGRTRQALVQVGEYSYGVLSRGLLLTWTIEAKGVSDEVRVLVVVGGEDARGYNQHQV